ncbi:MAG TPA: hypothetical protein VN914_07560 [Polyangia bacterium]|nr:hypothetical protein [Polyangia bacterium]
MKSDRPDQPPPSPLAAGLLALALCLQFLAASWLWVLMEDSGWFLGKGNYKTAWASSGYRGLPIEEVATGLNRHLPVETPIRLGSIDPQWAQRLKEGLYPRRIVPDAPYSLETGKSPAVPIAASPRGQLVLMGKLPAPPPSPPSGKVDFGRSWLRVILHLLASLGWGLALAVVLTRAWRPPARAPLWPATALAAPLVWGVLGTVATLLQRPLPFTALMVLGLVLGAAALVLSLRGRDLRGEWTRRLAWVRQPETWGMVAFSALLVRHMDVWPIVGWDGRSIWLYRAKQIAYNGYLTVADAINPENFFSHMEYPVLYPTWLAQFLLPGPLREREVALGIMALQLLLISTIWWLARRRLGRWPGAAFTAAVFLLTAANSERGFADGFISLFLLAMLFLLESEELEPLGWLAGLGAALTKGEGLVFAAMAGGLFVLFHPRFRAKRWLPRLAPPLVLLFGALPPLWAHVIGIKNQYTGAKLPPTLALKLDRLLIIWNGMGRLARELNFVAFIPAALGIFVVLEITRRRSWTARIMAAVGVGTVLFSVAVMMVTPYDVADQVQTALGRLLCHTAIVLGAAALAALTAEPTPGQPPG